MTDTLPKQDETVRVVDVEMLVQGKLATVSIAPLKDGFQILGVKTSDYKNSKLTAGN